MLWPMDLRTTFCMTGDIDILGEASNDRLQRLLDLLDDYKLPYTFFVTAQVLEENPEVVKPIVGINEIAGHGDTHIGFRGQSYIVQKKRLSRMVKVAKKVCGLHMKGFRAPYLSEDATTIQAANELGLLYDNTITTRGAWWWLFGDHISQKIGSKKIRSFVTNSYNSRVLIKILDSLYRLRPILEVAGATDITKLRADLPFNPMFYGKYRLGIKMIPLSPLDDYHLIDMGPKYKDWRKVAMVWKKEFDHHYEVRGLYVLLAHPKRIGTKKYIGALRFLIEHAVSKGDVWFTTISRVAEWWGSRPLSDDNTN